MAPKRLLKKSGGKSRRGASTRTKDKETSKKTSRSKKQDKMEVSATRRQFVSWKCPAYAHDMDTS